MQTYITGERQSNLDLLKGIGILCVILGHSGINSKMTYGIYLFHMPLFFFISGYLEKGILTIKPLILHKAKRLLYPYFVFGTLIILYNTLLDVIGGGIHHISLEKESLR